MENVKYILIDMYGVIIEESKGYFMTVVNDFIEDNYKLRRKKIVVIHGNGAHILKNKIQN